jgi:tRNA-uridine 2-sulfurtransferase
LISNFPLEIPEPLRRRLPPGTGVLLGISGGVDSAVALAVLKELQCEVMCVTFKNFCTSDSSITISEQSCCSLDAIEDARKLAGRFDVPHWVRNLEDPFREMVIDPFIAEYQAALTPNPCLACNADVRFPEMVKLASQQGLDFAATGHYARIEDYQGQDSLWEGVDPGKDQSYFLNRIDRNLFSRLVFPLGWHIKPDIRKAARELGISVADKRDSQEVCFVPDGDRSFLFQGPGATDQRAIRPGEIVNRDGQLLGQHRGLVYYTVGQRKGLGIAAPQPHYVLELDLENSRLVVGYKEELRTTKVHAEAFVPAVENFPAIADANYCESHGIKARVRHRHRGAAVRSWQLLGNRIELELAESVDGVAPGQGLVLYQGAMVLGGGRLILSSS